MLSILFYQYRNLNQGAGAIFDALQLTVFVGVPELRSTTRRRLT
jgi:hypothetical protein